MTTKSDSVAAGTAAKFPFRLIMRMNVAGKRVRRVRVLHDTEAGATERMAAIAEEIVRTEGGTEPSPPALYPPSGIRLDGKLSRGHEVNADGVIVKVKPGKAPAVVAEETPEPADEPESEQQQKEAPMEQEQEPETVE